MVQTFLKKKVTNFMHPVKKQPLKRAFFSFNKMKLRLSFHFLFNQMKKKRVTLIFLFYFFSFSLLQNHTLNLLYSLSLSFFILSFLPISLFSIFSHNQTHY